MAYDASPVKNRQTIKIPPLRCQYGDTPEIGHLRRQCGQKSSNPANLKNGRPHHNLTTKAWLFGYKYYDSAVKSPKNLATQARLIAAAEGSGFVRGTKNGLRRA
jgi:hypothetical protein